ncbi:hypothetical protein [Rhodocytophaga rosea]|nr:hypothetical protein [Rhodocytophaga rosea]
MKPAILPSTYFYSAYTHGVSYRHIAWQVHYSKTARLYMMVFTN